MANPLNVIPWSKNGHQLNFDKITISTGENCMDVYPNFEKNEIIAKTYSYDYSWSLCERKPHKKFLIAALFTVHLSRVPLKPEAGMKSEGVMQ